MSIRSDWLAAIRARFFNQLIRGRHLWWWLLISAVIVALTFYMPQSWIPRPASISDRTRWAGMLFQISGVYCVIAGLNDSRVFLGDSGIVTSVIRWLISWFHIFDKPRIVSGGVTINLPSVHMNLKAGTVQVNPTIETRLDALETHVATLKSETTKAVKDIRIHALKLVNQEREERSAALAEAGENLRTIVSGGIALQAAGALYLVVGIIFTSVPDEFSQMLSTITK